MDDWKPYKDPTVLSVIGALIAAIVLGFLLVEGLTEESFWYEWWPHLSMQKIVSLIRSSGPWGVVASISVMVAHSFVPFPAELVAIANGMVYGPLWGTVVTWTGAMLGAFLAFGLARLLGRPFVSRVLSERNNRRMDEWARTHGGGALLFSRFIPVIAFNLINYAAGLMNVSWWTFAWTTGLGILPLTALMVVMGDNIDRFPWYIWLLLLTGGLVLWLLTHRMLRWSDHGVTATDEGDETLPIKPSGE